MELDNDLQDALTYLDEPKRKEAMAYLEAAKDAPAEFALRRIGIMAEAEDSSRLGALRLSKMRHQSKGFTGQTRVSSPSSKPRK